MAVFINNNFSQFNLRIDYITLNYSTQVKQISNCSGQMADKDLLSFFFPYIRSDGQLITLLSIKIPPHLTTYCCYLFSVWDKRERLMGVKAQNQIN